MRQKSDVKQHNRQFLVVFVSVQRLLVGHSDRVKINGLASWLNNPVSIKLLEWLLSRLPLIF